MSGASYAKPAHEFCKTLAEPWQSFQTGEKKEKKMTEWYQRMSCSKNKRCCSKVTVEPSPFYSSFRNTGKTTGVISLKRQQSSSKRIRKKKESIKVPMRIYAPAGLRCLCTKTNNAFVKNWNSFCLENMRRSFIMLRAESLTPEGDLFSVS